MTSKQREYLRVICRYHRSYLRPPTYRDLARLCGVTMHAAFCVVRTLESLGMVRLGEKASSRRIFVTDLGWSESGVLPPPRSIRVLSDRDLAEMARTARVSR